MVYLVGFICILNVVLWIVFFVKFNKRFSTKTVIEQTRAEMNEILKDMQRNTNHNIDLITGSIERLKQINRDAEQSIIVLNKKLEVLNSDIAFKNGVDQIHAEIQSKISSQGNSKKTEADNAPQKKKRNTKSATQSRPRAVYPPINSINSFQAYQVNKIPQRDLFSDESLEIKDEVVVTQDGAAYREVPVITTKILDEQPKKRSINDRVMDLYNLGNSVEEIAAELSVSTTEVQFIIDLG